MSICRAPEHVMSPIDKGAVESMDNALIPGNIFKSHFTVKQRNQFLDERNSLLAFVYIHHLCLILNLMMSTR